MEVKENIDLKPYTYFKIGGSSRFFAEVKTEDEVQEAIRFAKSKKLPLCVLGAASNVLVADKGFEGLVMRMQLRDISREGTLLTAGAGVPNAVLVARTIQESLAGLEWAIGIPGSVGGSIRGNAGCFSGEMRDVIHRVRFLNTETGKIEEGDNDFCKFDYRESIFKKSPHLVITQATFALREGDPETIQRLVRFYTSSRTSSQDIGSSSAGCVFKNALWPELPEARTRLLGLLPELAEFKNRDTIPAGFLIDRMGLKGARVGKAHVSEKHGNYVINDGGSTSEEVIMLIGLIKERIHRKFGIHLKEEIQYVGF